MEAFPPQPPAAGTPAAPLAWLKEPWLLQRGFGTAGEENNVHLASTHTSSEG